MKMQRNATLMLAFSAVMTVVLTLCGWITIPFVVPFTLQTFGVFMALKLLGGKWGSASILLYVLLGAVGVPVFSSFRGGISVLLGPTGGYIIGFLITGMLYWLLEDKLKNDILQDVVLFAGLLLCYAFGTAWFIVVMQGKGNPYTLGAALMTCVVPFLLPDAAKLVLAHFLAARLRPVMKKIMQKNGVQMKENGTEKK